MVIPNKEIKEVYKLQIQEWFKNTVLSNTEQLTSFWNAIQTGKAEVIETYLNRILSNSISVFDTKVRNEEKESSYHKKYPSSVLNYTGDILLVGINYDKESKGNVFKTFCY